ncbi:YdeI/OmpD-associated family protein [Paracoccus ravus]|uniref:YdeI/OmpD-associated family protein n=1 Tax=Paracoccus ravus TaxID=2447760 RepID=UPI00106EA13E|nr:YdeI/OmpD-associated family protein [Paracoccus ravus]
MTDINPKVEAYFDNPGLWPDEQRALREILLASPLTEDFKWRSPVYTHQGANIAIIWGFKDRAALGFFKGVLLKDPEGILDAPGENSRSSRGANFTDLATIKALRPTLLAYIDEAIALENAGAKVDLPKDDLDYPQELVDRLDKDADFKFAFEALTPGRRRSWVLHVSQAKQSETRIARIDKAAPKIREGKGLNDR